MVTVPFCLLALHPTLAHALFEVEVESAWEIGNERFVCKLYVTTSTGPDVVHRLVQPHPMLRPTVHVQPLRFLHDIQGRY